MLYRLKEQNEGHLLAEIIDLQMEVDILLEEENSNWQQRVKKNWLREGDRNIAFFHKCASQRRKQNTISKIFNEVGQELRSQQEISHEFQQYFQNLFTSFNPIGIAECLTALPSKLTTEMRAMLSQPFSKTEVKKALISMNPLGSPGPDGFPAVCFLDHWSTVDRRVTRAVLSILNGGKWSNGVNETFITSIPKKTTPLADD
ncbi:uncharacterized protein LOC122274694 [Carya illinoinensis]|uniref:uncharacterized protein LOC122274694 n=1 Tax=Carya illinoinensis TaxID=32201 RepID=UPI001C72620C|nr:uncharacterized protein LOC122274694 [Carya illinoinensis]